MQHDVAKIKQSGICVRSKVRTIDQYRKEPNDQQSLSSVVRSFAHRFLNSVLLLSDYAVLEEESSYFDNRLFRARWCDCQRTNRPAFRIEVRLQVADVLPGRSLVEFDLERVMVAGSLIAENIFTRAQLEVAALYRHLSHEEMRILALSRIAGGYHYDSGDEFAIAIGDAGRGAK